MLFSFKCRSAILITIFFNLYIPKGEDSPKISCTKYGQMCSFNCSAPVDACIIARTDHSDAVRSLVTISGSSSLSCPRMVLLSHQSPQGDSDPSAPLLPGISPVGGFSLCSERLEEASVH